MISKDSCAMLASQDQEVCLAMAREYFPNTVAVYFAQSMCYETVPLPIGLHSE